MFFQTSKGDIMRGGKRENAGRKSTGTTTTTICVPIELKDEILNYVKQVKALSRQRADFDKRATPKMIDTVINEILLDTGIQDKERLIEYYQHIPKWQGFDIDSSCVGELKLFANNIKNNVRMQKELNG